MVFLLFKRKTLNKVNALAVTSAFDGAVTPYNYIMDWEKGKVVTSETNNSKD